MLDGGAEGRLTGLEWAALVASVGQVVKNNKIKLWLACRFLSYP